MTLRQIILNVFLISVWIIQIDAIGEILDPSIPAIEMRDECKERAFDRPCPPVGGPPLEEDIYPPDLFCPCPASGLPGQGALLEATGEPTSPNPHREFFEDYLLVGGFPNSVAMSFTDTNELFVATREGVVHLVDLESGESRVYVDLSDEVAYGGDRGLMDVEAHPKYSENGYVYLVFSVDPNPGDGENPPSDMPVNQRLIRLKEEDGSLERFTLFGAGEWDGPPLCFTSHAVGSLVFGWDSSLFVSIGDGAHWDFTYGDFGQNAPNSYDELCGEFGKTALSSYPKGNEQDVGAFRSQIHTSLSGKILRMTAEGLGICEDTPGSQEFSTKNPFCDDSGGTSIASKIWALGLRNPFRMNIRSPSAGEDPMGPGVLYVADVGTVGYEEVNVVTEGGMNFGWPCWEGPLTMPDYRDSPYNRISDPFNIRNVHGCGGALCGPLEALPILPNGDRLNCPYMYHNMTTVPPFFYYNRYPEFNDQGFRQESAYLNQGFTGACIGGIAVYNGGSYPPQYRDTVFILDFSDNWVKVLYRKDGDNYERVEDFEDLIFSTPADGSKITLETNPKNGEICYSAMTAGEIRCFHFTQENIAPFPSISYAQPSRGNSREVQFSSDGTFDREGDPIAIKWDFGDGTRSFDPNPLHIYESKDTFTVTLTATDVFNHSRTEELTFSTASLPPVVRIASPVPAYERHVIVSPDEMVRFEAEVEDDNPDSLEYNWEFQFVHFNHYHPDQLNVRQASFEMEGSTLPQEVGAERGNLRIILHVTNADGLTSSDFIRVSPEGWEEDLPNDPPIPKFEIESEPIVGEPITFNSQGTIEPNQDRIMFEWDFGDGFQGEGEAIVHIFQGEKTSTIVTLTTTDNWGASASYSEEIVFKGYSKECSRVGLSEERDLVCINNGLSLGSSEILRLSPYVEGAEKPSLKFSLSSIEGVIPSEGTSSLRLWLSTEYGEAEIAATLHYDSSNDGIEDRMENFGAVKVTNKWTEFVATSTVKGASGNVNNGTIELIIEQNSPTNSAVFLQVGNPRHERFSSLQIPLQEAKHHYLLIPAKPEETVDQPQYFSSSFASVPSFTFWFLVTFSLYVLKPIHQ